jgi:acetate kinase
MWIQGLFESCFEKVDSLVFHYATNVGKLSPSSTESLHISRAEEILNKESGWKALTGTTNFGTIASSSDPEMKLAFDIFVDRILGYIGSYYVSLHGKVDALVFAGGIGEKSDLLRTRVTDEASCLGFEIDGELNSRRIEDVVQEVGKKEAKHRTLVCQTNEQFEMARLVSVNEKLFGWNGDNTQWSILAQTYKGVCDYERVWYWCAV